MYYPKSQVKPNLYTNGGELVNATTLEDYVGYYYETSNGEKFVGKAPKGNSQILLIPPPLETPEDIKYSNKFIRTIAWQGDADPETYFDEELLNSLTVGKYLAVNADGIPSVRKIPSPIKGYYTSEDAQKGFYLRYFSKKLNENYYFEISKEDYNLLKSKDPKIAFDLYGYCSLMWSIDNFAANQGNASLIEKRKKWVGFEKYTERLENLLSPLETTLQSTTQTSPPPQGSTTLGASGGGTSGGGSGY